MGRDLPESYENRPRRSRADEAGGYGPPSGERSSGRRESARGPSSRSGMTPPRNGNLRPGGNGGGGGVIRPPLIADGPDDGGSGRRSGSSAANDTPSRRNGSRNGSPNGGGRDASDASGERRTPGRRRSMAEMARDVSRTMSRQLSSIVSRVGRAAHPRNDDMPTSRRDPPREWTSSNPPISGEMTDALAAAPYRRSRARLVARKWRQRRVRPNPIGYIVVAMVIMLLTLVVAVGGGAGMAYAVTYYQAHIGQIQAIATLRDAQSSTIYDRYGRTIYVVKGDNSSYRFYIPITQISPLVQWATIDTEDRTFYQNPGIDVAATLRAALTDVKAGGASQGGSGITQQLVKIAVLDDSTKELQRKINEAIISVGMTTTGAYDKAFILEMYLNSIDYGDQNTGIEAAARNFFGYQQKPDPAHPGKYILANQQLDLAQIAILVGLPNAPSEFLPIKFSCEKAPCPMSQWDNPWKGAPCGLHIDEFGPDWYYSHGHEWLDYCRALEVIDNLHLYGGPGINYSDAQIEQAKNEVQTIFEQQQIYHWKGLLNGSASSENGAINLAPHFVQYVTEQLANDFGLDHLESAGVSIYTTLDLDLQNEMQNVIKFRIKGNYKDEWYGNPYVGGLAATENVHNAGGIAMNQYTGDILAMVGSVDYNSKDKRVAGAVNITTANQPMGSATKPIVYATAFQKGWTPGIMLQDQPICFPGKVDPDPYTHKDVKNPDAKACTGYYAPRNYDETSYSGNFPLRRQLADSLNIAATETMSFVGYGGESSDAFLAMAQRLGITTLKKDQLGPTTALGAQDIPLIQLTGAFATFANLGKRNPPRAILRIERNSKILWEAPSKTHPAQVLSPQVAYMLTNVLSDNFARYPDFKYHNPLHPDPPYDNMELAAKTGTSSGKVGPRDIVTAGYSPYMTVGIWAGNSNAEDLAQGIIGIAGAGYIFHDVMKWAAKWYKWDETAHFEVPSGLAYGSFNCHTGLAPYKDAKADDMKCHAQGVPSLSYGPKGYRRINPYNPDPTRNPTPPPWISGDWGIDYDLYIQGQEWTTS